MFYCLSTKTICS